MPDKIRSPQGTDNPLIDRHESVELGSGTSSASTRLALDLAINVRAVPPNAAFKPGELVHIFQIVPFRRPFIEGSAWIIAGAEDAAGVYYVQFEGESRLVRRKVLSGMFQTDPDQALEVLLVAWRLSTSSEMNLGTAFDHATPANDNSEG